MACARSACEVEAEPGHPVGRGFEHHPAVQGRGAVSGVQRFGVQPFPQGAESAAQGGVGLAWCPVQRGRFERGRGIRGQPGDGSKMERTWGRLIAPAASAARVAGCRRAVPASATRAPAVRSGSIRVVASSARNDRVPNSRCTGVDPSCTPSTACAYPCARSISRNCSACAARIRRSSTRIASRSACNAAAALVAPGVVMHPSHHHPPTSGARRKPPGSGKIPVQNSSLTHPVEDKSAQQSHGSHRDPMALTKWARYFSCPRISPGWFIGVCTLT